MTTIRFTRVRGRLTGFTCSGHSGYAEAGEDIICAAISSAVTMAECIINDVFHAGAEVSVDEISTRISLKLPKSCGQLEACQGILEGFLMCMKELQNDNPEHLTVLEV